VFSFTSGLPRIDGFVSDSNVEPEARACPRSFHAAH
jgi:hypothetical protein